MPVPCDCLQGLDMIFMYEEAFYSGRGCLTDGSWHITVLLDSIFRTPAHLSAAPPGPTHHTEQDSCEYTTGKVYPDLYVYRRECM